MSRRALPRTECSFVPVAHLVSVHVPVCCGRWGLREAAVQPLGRWAVCKNRRAPTRAELATVHKYKGTNPLLTASTSSVATADLNCYRHFAPCPVAQSSSSSITLSCCIDEAGNASMPDEAPVRRQ